MIYDPTKINRPMTAYFSMEIALENGMPTYSGGLGVLAGDTIKAAADMEMPFVAVTLLYRQGYFQQTLDPSGRQGEKPVDWNILSWFPHAPTQAVTIQMQGRPVKVRAYRYDYKGVTGHVVPVFFLDTDFADNDASARSWSHSLYSGDQMHRLCQETVLGIGGFTLLKHLGYAPQQGKDRGPHRIATYHMNEGHAALVTLALAHEGLRDGHRDAKLLPWVRDHCAFTTHTPVSAGHDRFDRTTCDEVLGESHCSLLVEMGAFKDAELNMSHLALEGSRYTNGVSRRHGEVSRRMFSGTPIDAITNGVHATTWVGDGMAGLFDKEVPLWRKDNFALREICDIPVASVMKAHAVNKEKLFHRIATARSVDFDPSAFTIGFARRATEYKRAWLLLQDPQRLINMAEVFGPIQLVYAGKSHPRDEGGKKAIMYLHEKARLFSGTPVKFVYLENYDMDWGRLICSGVDLWLNNPVKPLEASGTSGMKAALNGVPSLSTLDGWWIEGCFERVTGWEITDQEDAFGQDRESGQYTLETAKNLYRKLEDVILPLYYRDPEGYGLVRRNCVSINGPWFTTQRMVDQYQRHAYNKPLA